MKKFRAALIGCGRIGSEFDKKYRANRLSRTRGLIVCVE